MQIQDIKQKLVSMHDAKEKINSKKGLYQILQKRGVKIQKQWLL